MKKEHAIAFFELAGFKIKSIHELPNGYWSNHSDYAEIRAANPWWLVETEFGIIKIGWRKRVIQIDWKSTGMSITEPALTIDSTTLEKDYVHAWTHLKCLEYLTDLNKRMKEIRRVEETKE